MTKANGASNDAKDVLRTVREIAALDRVSAKTVRRAIEAGLLQAMRVGPGSRLLRVSQHAHETYRKAQRL